MYFLHSNTEIKARLGCAKALRARARSSREPPAFSAYGFSPLVLSAQPRAASVAGLGTFHIQKWLSFEDGAVLTFHRPVFALAGAVAQVRELQHASIPAPGKRNGVTRVPLCPYTRVLCWLLFRSDGDAPEVPGEPLRDDTATK